MASTNRIDSILKAPRIQNLANYNTYRKDMVFRDSNDNLVLVVATTDGTYANTTFKVIEPRKEKWVDLTSRIINLAEVVVEGKFNVTDSTPSGDVSLQSLTTDDIGKEILIFNISGSSRVFSPGGSAETYSGETVTSWQIPVNGVWSGEVISRNGVARLRQFPIAEASDDLFVSKRSNYTATGGDLIRVDVPNITISLPTSTATSEGAGVFEGSVVAIKNANAVQSGVKVLISGNITNPSTNANTMEWDVFPQRTLQFIARVRTADGAIFWSVDTDVAGVTTYPPAPAVATNYYRYYLNTLRNANPSANRFYVPLDVFGTVTAYFSDETSGRVRFGGQGLNFDDIAGSPLASKGKFWINGQAADTWDFTFPGVAGEIKFIANYSNGAHWDVQVLTTSASTKNLYVVSGDFAQNLAKNYQGQPLKDYIRTTLIDSNTAAMGPIVRSQAISVSDALTALGHTPTTDSITLVQMGVANRTLSGTDQIPAGLYTIGKNSSGFVWVAVEIHRPGIALDVGFVCYWSGAAPPNDGWLFLNGQTGLKQSDYPDFFAALNTGQITACATITTPDNGSGNGVFSLANWNVALNDGRGRSLESLGNSSVGQLKTSRTAPSTLKVDGNAFDDENSGVGGSTWPEFTDMSNAPRARTVTGGDLQTRAPAIALPLMVRVKAWAPSVTGNLTINQTPPNYRGLFLAANQAGDTGFVFTADHQVGGAGTLSTDGKTITVPASGKFFVTVSAEHYAEGVGSTRIDFYVNDAKHKQSLFTSSNADNTGSGTGRTLTVNGGDRLRATRVRSNGGGNSSISIFIEQG